MSGSLSFQVQKRSTPTVKSQGWNSGHSNSQITINNNNLTAAMTGSGTYVKAFGINGFGQNQYTADRYYFEIVVNYSSQCRAGIANSNSGLTGALGASIDEIGWQFDGSVNNNGTSVATWSSYTTGQTLRFAVDLVQNLIWGRVGLGPWNNSSQASPYTGSGGLAISSSVTAYPVVPAIHLFQSSLPDHHVAYFASNSWQYSPPIGFLTMDVTSSLSWANAGGLVSTSPLNVDVTGLTTATSYDFQVIASNNSGQTASNIKTQVTN